MKTPRRLNKNELRIRIAQKNTSLST